MRLLTILAKTNKQCKTYEARAQYCAIRSILKANGPCMFAALVNTFFGKPASYFFVVTFVTKLVMKAVVVKLPEVLVIVDVTVLISATGMVANPQQALEANENSYRASQLTNPHYKKFSTSCICSASAPPTNLEVFIVNPCTSPMG